MFGQLKDSFKIALRLSFLISILFALLLFVIFQIAGIKEYVLILWSAFFGFFIAAAVINYNAEKYIVRTIKQLYNNVSLLENSDYRNLSVTTDMDSLRSEIENFAEGKKIEIETLKIKEEYRKDFIGNVAHELKTPLFTVQGYLLTLLEGAMDDKKVRKKYLDRANKSVERLLHIVRDLDDITRLESGSTTMNFSDFNIIDLIEDIFEMLEMEAQKAAINLILDKDYSEAVMVYADEEKIEQVLYNLIQNSIKYGSPDGTTEVSVESLTANKIIVRVTDNGEGIPEVHLSRLFERFYRVDQSGSRKEGGSGLGLSIVKHIVEAHEEKIFVESEPELGSEFSFTLQKASLNSELQSMDSEKTESPS